MVKNLNDDINVNSSEITDANSVIHKRGYKLYNFKRPDKFSKDNLRALHDIHREFSKQVSLVLTGYLRMRVDVDVVSVDQLTYEEFIKSMPSPMNVGVFEFSPLPGQVLFGICFEVLSCMVDRMLGGNGKAEAKVRDLTDVEKALAKRMISVIVNTLCEAWSGIVPVESKVVGLDDNYQTIQIATPGEIVALLTFEVQLANKNFGLASLCFPYPVLETVLSRLSTQHIFQTKGIVATSEERQKMIQKLNTSKVDIRTMLGSCEISLEDFLQLSVGDIVRLDNKVTDDLIVKVNGEKKFFARPGTLKKNVCVKITDIYNEMYDVLRAYI